MTFWLQVVRFKDSSESAMMSQWGTKKLLNSAIGGGESYPSQVSVQLAHLPIWSVWFVELISSGTRQRSWTSESPVLPAAAANLYVSTPGWLLTNATLN